MQHLVYTNGRDHEIIQLFTNAFSHSEGNDEGKQIGNLVTQLLKNTPKAQRFVFLSLEENQIIGGVVFSKLFFEESNSNIWLLSPAAVATNHQGKGVGQGLIKFAHHYLKDRGVQQVVTYGDIQFYKKVGYQPITTKEIPAPFPLSYPEGWIAQSLVGNSIESISGKVTCVQAISKEEYW